MTSKPPKSDQTLSPQLFLGTEFNPNDLIVTEALQGLPSGSSESLSNQLEVLLQRLDRLDVQLAKAQQSQQLGATSREGSLPEPINFRTAAVTARLATLQTSLSVLESRATAITQLASRVGVRMQHIEEQRRRALSAASLLHNLNEFVQAEDPDQLPYLFYDDMRITESAAIAGKLHQLLRRVMEGPAPTGTALDPGSPFSGGPPTPTPHPASLKSASQCLNDYLDQLDTRIVSQFDTAMAGQDLVTMATCCTAMAAARGSDALLVARYISTRPIFANPEEVERLKGAGPLSEDPGKQSMSNSISNSSNNGVVGAPPPTARITSEVFRTLSNFLREESMVMEQVFVDPGSAIATLVQRVFAQTVQELLGGALVAPPSDAPAEVLRSHLRLLTDTHRKAMALAEEGRGLAGAALGDPSDLAAAACGAALDQYLAIELKYLAELGGSKLSTAAASVSREVVLDLLSLNEEAMKRCISISEKPQVAANVRVLFHPVAAAEISLPGGLLGQVGTHLLKGLTAATQKCFKRLNGTLRPAHGEAASVAGQSQSNSRAAALRAAAPIEVGQPLETLLGTLTEVAACIVLLRKYYARVVQPHLAPSLGDEQACATGLSELIAAVNDRCGWVLQQLITACIRKIDATLLAEQRRADFRPSQSEPDPPLDQPTTACCAVVALLLEMGRQAGDHLHGPNRTSFLTELTDQTVATLRAHMLRFVFSITGALRWQRDVSTYGSCLSDDVGAPNARRLFEDLHALSNVLVVNPESLPHVLPELEDIKLRLGPNGVSPEEYLERREDYKTAVAGIVGKMQ